MVRRYEQGEQLLLFVGTGPRIVEGDGLVPIHTLLGLLWRGAVQGIWDTQDAGIG